MMNFFNVHLYYIWIIEYLNNRYIWIIEYLNNKYIWIIEKKVQLIYLSFFEDWLLLIIITVTSITFITETFDISYIQASTFTWTSLKIIFH